MNNLIQFLTISYPVTVVAVFILFFIRLMITGKRTKKAKVCMAIFYAADNLVEPFMFKKFSLATLSIVISLVGISSAGAAAALDGLLSVTSSDDSVLTVTPLDGGLFRVDFIGVGQASLRVSGDADLGDGVRTISQEYEFEIYDQGDEADHFDLSIVEVQPKVAVAGDASASATDTATDSSTATS